MVDLVATHSNKLERGLKELDSSAKKISRLTFIIKT